MLSGVGNDNRAMAMNIGFMKSISILRRFLHAVDHNHVKRPLGGFQPEAKLLWKHCEYRWQGLGVYIALYQVTRTWLKWSRLDVEYAPDARLIQDRTVRDSRQGLSQFRKIDCFRCQTDAHASGKPSRAGC